MTKVSKTDKEGRVLIEGFPRGEFLANIRASVSKPGYYKTKLKDLDYTKKSHAVDVTLRKVGSPVGMYARRILLELPELGKNLGYDFKVGDWVRPHGVGETADCVFHCVKQFENEDNYKVAVTMKFTEPHSGIMPDSGANSKRDWRSEFNAKRVAPLREFKSEQVFTAQKSSQSGYDGSSHELSYIFRSRAKIGPEGKLLSANYGKLSNAASVRHGAGLPDMKVFIAFTYYFNPTPNDRNLEFDPKRNLFGELSWEQRVSDP